MFWTETFDNLIVTFSDTKSLMSYEQFLILTTFEISLLRNVNWLFFGFILNKCKIKILYSAITKTYIEICTNKYNYARYSTK